MKPNLKLLKSCLISSGRVVIDGQTVFTDAQADFSTFSNTAYKALQIDYPKFHKMDNLSKLGFLAAEYLLSGLPLLSHYKADKVGVVVANANSSTDTDLRYNTQVKQELPSPALFVYTLPNIVVGEICIRHGIKGENTLFVSPQFDAAAQTAYISVLFEDKLVDICLGGWIDFFNEEYLAFFYLVGTNQEPNSLNYSTENVEKLFNT
jgi:hypothetical protein